MINPNNPNGGFIQGLKPAPFTTTFTGTGAPRALFRVDVANFLGLAKPSHILVFGKNDDLNDSNPADSTNVMMLYSTQTTPPTLVGEGSADLADPFNEAMSFAWITPPTSTSSTAEFVVSGGAMLQKYTVSDTGTFTCTGTCTMVFDPDAGLQNSVTSIVAPPGASANYIVVALGNGRIFLMGPNLQFLRSADRESPNLGDPTGWFSNRTLAQCMTTDLVQASDGGDADLYFADYSEPFRVEGGVSKFRLGRLHLSIGANPPTWVPYLGDIKNPAVEDERRGANRTLIYRDLDGDSVREAHVFAETGTAWKDAETGAVREFCTYSYMAGFNYSATWPYSTRVAKGGNVFEYFDPPPGGTIPSYYYLSGFHVPRDGTTPFEDFGGSDWWYPQHGVRLSGQISNYSQSALSFNFGTSMKTAMIRPDDDPMSTTVPHVVVGTNGANVYAIRPGPVTEPVTSGGRPSQLGYASRCFGTTIIGMDVGDLDGDADQEIVVGEWMDKGTYVDWTNHNTAKNRAHLHVLDPSLPSPGNVGTFNVTDLDGDDLLGAGNGIGAGVTGVRIDDYNHDGLPDIWCADAIGHVYLFKHTTGGLPWQCVYRSQDLGACPGLYNQIYVMKDENHKTTRLILLSSGYVMAFAVDPTLF